MNEPVPLVDLGIQRDEIADEVAEGFADVIGRTAFVNGEPVKAFETEFAAFSGATACVGVANGTDAIELALRALGVASADSVVLPANTFIATAEAVARIGARPVLVDCDEHQLIDVGQAVAAVDHHGAAALIAVDLFGQLAPLAHLRAELGSRPCHLIEDAAQSQGATQHGVGVAGVADIAATSFYPGKNLGAYGDAGAVLTNDERLADAVRLLADHGSRTRYLHEVIGMNSRLDTLQAVVLRAKLRRLATWNDQRRAAARRYDELLADHDAITTPTTAPGNEHVWHLYVVRVPNRDAVLTQLHEQGIGAGIHYPVPIHLTPAFADLGLRRGAFPRAEQAAGEILSLPIFPGITEAQQERVADAVAKAVVSAG